MIIDTFWGLGDEAVVEASFLDESSSPAIQSWLFLGVELRARSAGP